MLFRSAVLAGTIDLRRATDEDIVAAMIAHDLPALSGDGVATNVDSYDYLLRLRMDRVKAAIAATNTGLVWSPNFSIVVVIFTKLVREASKWMAAEQQYGAWAWEIHHITKKDAPSGTMIKLVEEMKSAGYPRGIDVAASRAGAHPGTHEIGFDSAADTITLRHAARSREGFARGALRAAQWIPGKRGVFEFSEVFGEMQ